MNDLRKLLKDLDKFKETVNTQGFEVNKKFLEELKKYMQKKYSNQGDLVDIKLNKNNDIEIIGYKFKSVKTEVSKIIDDAKTYNFPETWDDTIDLLQGSDNCVLKEVN